MPLKVLLVAEYLVSLCCYKSKYVSCSCCRSYDYVVGAKEKGVGYGFCRIVKGAMIGGRK